MKGIPRFRIAFFAVMTSLCAVASNWNFGPFFQYRTKREGGTLLAFRPFFESETFADGSSAYDILWPLGTSHSADGNDYWWRFLILYGDEHHRDGEADKSFNVFPLWFSGVDRTGEDYWGFFPFYGRHPHILLMDDWQFAMWPVWQRYKVKDVESVSVLWPFFTHRNEPRFGLGLWPFSGVATQRESRHGYAFWPLATWASYDEDRDTSGKGVSWMAWPFVGHVDREREDQWLVLPPFFSWVKTDSSKRLRLPWPIVDLERTPRRDRVSVWPVYEQVYVYSFLDGKKTHPEEVTRRYGWKLIEDTTLETGRTRERVFSVFPFWNYEYVELVGENGKSSAREVCSFVRIWPFWRKETLDGKAKVRVLDLLPIRHSDGWDRTWAPFFTFYTSEDRASYTRHSLFWHLITWKTYPKSAEPYKDREVSHE